MKERKKINIIVCIKLMHFYCQQLRNFAITSAYNKSNALPLVVDLPKRAEKVPNCTSSWKTISRIIINLQK